MTEISLIVTLNNQFTLPYYLILKNFIIGNKSFLLRDGDFIFGIHVPYDKEHTVNVVIFAGEKFSENIAKTVHAGSFSRYFSYFLNKAMCVLFSRGEFSRRRQYHENAKITPHAIISTFTVMPF